MTHQPRSIERLIQLLNSVNGEAIDNDGGKPGEFIEKLCREAAEARRTAEVLRQVAQDIIDRDAIRRV